MWSDQRENLIKLCEGSGKKLSGKMQEKRFLGEIVFEKVRQGFATFRFEGLWIIEKDMKVANS
jgi:hypothetical protein